MRKSEPKKKDIIIPRDFVHWWEPWGNDQTTGASIGGHPDSERLWARPEPEGGYARRLFGTKTKQAWICEYYRNQYEEWKSLGSPERKDFVSLAAPKEKQNEFWHELAPIIAMIGLRPTLKRGIQRQFKTDELLPRLREKYPACPYGVNSNTVET